MLLHACPCTSRLTTAVNWSMRASPAPSPRASRTCWIRRPVGPGAVSAGKLRRALLTHSTSSTGAMGSSCNGGTEGAGDVGCSRRRAATISGVSGQSPCESRAVQAFLSKPSRASPMAYSSFCSSVRCLWARLDGCGRLSHKEARSPSCHRCSLSTVKAAAARWCLRPPRGGAHKTVWGSISRCTQARSLYSATAARARVKQRAHRERALRGTCRKVGVRLDCNSDTDGNAPSSGPAGLRAAGGAAARAAGRHVGWMPKRVATLKPHTPHR